MSEEKPMTREAAMREFRALVRQYGMRWTPASVPDKAAWDRMAEVQKVLSTEDRREALGLPNATRGRQ